MVRVSVFGTWQYLSVRVYICSASNLDASHCFWLSGDYYSSTVADYNSHKAERETLQQVEGFFLRGFGVLIRHGIADFYSICLFGIRDG